eukprot:6214581-Pleurochrysis_carterae.AAC.1
MVSGAELCNFDQTDAQGIIFAFHELPCSLDNVCSQLLEFGAAALLRIEKKGEVGRVGQASRKFFDDRSASCVPYLHAAWLDDSSMEFLASGGKLNAVIRVGSENPWEEMYSS